MSPPVSLTACHGAPLDAGDAMDATRRADAKKFEDTATDGGALDLGSRPRHDDVGLAARRSSC